MSDWRRFCRTNEFDVQGESVRVRFPNQRTQQVVVAETAAGYRLRSTVIGAAAVRSLLEQGGEAAERDLCLRLLRRNRSAPLVGFKWTPGNRILAESHVPAAGLSQEEFRLHVRSVAREADRLEHLLTGQDRN